MSINTWLAEYYSTPAEMTGSSDIAANGTLINKMDWCKTRKY